MKKIEKWLIVGGLLLLSFHLVAFVPWTGRGYYKQPPTPTETGVWTPNGSFGLEREGRAAYWSAWNPPLASGPGVQAVPRWPWQPIVHTHQVEIDLLRLAARCSAGVIGLGLLLALFNVLNRRREPSVLRSVVYSLAVSQALTWIATPGLYFLIGPYGLDEHLTTILLSSGVADVGFGCLVGGWRTLRRRRTVVTPISPFEMERYTGNP